MKYLIKIIEQEISKLDGDATWLDDSEVRKFVIFYEPNISKVKLVKIIEYFKAKQSVKVVD